MIIADGCSRGSGYLLPASRSLFLLTFAMSNAGTSTSSPSASASQSRSASPEARPDEPEDAALAKDSSKEDEDSERAGDAEEQSTSEPSTSTAASALNATSPEQQLAVNPSALVQGDWQAIWSPQHSMYYFYNARTNETTWTNPLAGAGSEGTSSTSTLLNSQVAAAAQGIDPALAYLDPTLTAGPSNPSALTYTAKFNARTGAFTAPDARNPDHVSEYERMKRMSNVFFDMDAWQAEVEARQTEEEAGKKRKKPTKKDLVRVPSKRRAVRLMVVILKESFKERKRQKKLAKTAWLRT